MPLSGRKLWLAGIGGAGMSGYGSPRLGEDAVAAENKRIHKFDKTYDGANFENYIFILEPHPFNESILLSADYDGKVRIL